ncbi:MAG: hypothetical protein ACC657_08285 [Thiohalomonadales bacterium]
MLNKFRQAKKAYAVLITVMLLLPMQQSFSQTLKSITLFSVDDTNMSMKHCRLIADTGVKDNLTAKPGKTKTSLTSSNRRQENCCDKNNCDTNSCTSSISFITLSPNQDLIHSFEPQRHVSSVEQSERRVLHTELFRPPRKI